MHCPGIKFGVPELFWELLQASGEKTSLSSSSATTPRSGEPVNGIGNLGSSDYSLISDRATRDVAWRSRRCKGHKSGIIGPGRPGWSPTQAPHRSDLWPQLFSDVNCVALWISSEKILTRLYSVLYWFHKRLEVNIKNSRENPCFQIVIVFSLDSVDNSNNCTVLCKITARLITVSTSVNNEMCSGTNLRPSSPWPPFSGGSSGCGSRRRHRGWVCRGPP